MTSCSVLTRPSGSEESEPYNTLSAEEGGYVNIRLHTCNNMLSTSYTHCRTPASRSLAESAFICFHSLTFCSWVLACMYFTLWPEDSTFIHIENALEHKVGLLSLFLQTVYCYTVRLLTGLNAGKYCNYYKKHRDARLNFPNSSWLSNNKR